MASCLSLLTCVALLYILMAYFALTLSSSVALGSFAFLFSSILSFLTYSSGSWHFWVCSKNSYWTLSNSSFDSKKLAKVPFKSDTNYSGVVNPFLKLSQAFWCIPWYSLSNFSHVSWLSVGYFCLMRSLVSCWFWHTGSTWHLTCSRITRNITVTVFLVATKFRKGSFRPQGQSGRTGTMHLLTGELEVFALDVFL